MSTIRIQRPVALILSVAASVATATPAKRDDQILIQGIVAGSQTVAAQGTDSVRAEYSFNDRGRGDHIVATWKLDAAGVPIEYSASGNDCHRVLSCCRRQGSELTQYEISGLDFGPTSIWLDADGNTTASLSGWFSVVSAANAGASSLRRRPPPPARGLRSSRGS